MSFFLAIVALVASGIGCLRLAGLATGRLSVDLPLAWFVGGGWFATLIAGLRFLGGVPYTRLVALLVVAAPVLACLVLRGKALFARADGRAAPDGAQAAARARSRLLPRPAWLFAPIAAWVLFIAWAVSVQAVNTPTETDDGVRVRAFTPVLALADDWSPEERSLVPVAGTLPTWVPTLAWRLTGEYDTFHVNYAIVTSFLALLALSIGLATSRGAPARGWASALALTSLPLFLYHCTSTYTDALLAIHLGAGLLFFLEHDRTREPADAACALLFFVFAAFIKREGTLLALGASLPLLYSLVRERARGAPIRVGAFAVVLSPLLVDALASIVSVGATEAFPVLSLLTGSNPAHETVPNNPEIRAQALAKLAPALFSSGNAGMLYWILLATVLVPLRRPWASRRMLPLASVAILLGLWAVSSVFIVPAFTVDGSTVHRALMIVSVPAALWVAAMLSEWAAPSERAAPGAPPCERVPS